MALEEVMISEYRLHKEFYTHERCHIIELYNDFKDEGCSIARARVEPGVTTRLHALQGITERYVILEGAGQVEIDGDKPKTVGPLDVVAIPAGASQKITNIGGTDLVFLCVCTPRFMIENYIDQEI